MTWWGPTGGAPGASDLVGQPLLRPGARFHQFTSTKLRAMFSAHSIQLEEANASEPNLPLQVQGRKIEAVVRGYYAYR